VRRAAITAVILALTGCEDSEDENPLSRWLPGSEEEQVLRRAWPQHASESLPSLNPAPILPGAFGAPGPRLFPGHFEGVFPPAWHTGDQWRIVVIARVPNYGTDRLEPLFEKLGFLFRVLREPDGPGGEWLIDIRRFFVPEEVERMNPKHIKQYHPRQRYTAAFWALDGSLSWIQYEGNSQVTESDLIGSGPHAYENVGMAPNNYMLFDDPVLAYPCLPAGMENPLGYEIEAFTDGGRGWQTVFPTDDGLVFELRSGDFTETTGRFRRDVRVVWKRGDPWWSSVTSTFRGRVPDEGMEVVDGREVHGLLLRPGDPDWPEGYER
jgi:hypothetical protein